MMMKKRETNHNRKNTVVLKQYENAKEVQNIQVVEMKD